MIKKSVLLLQRRTWFVGVRVLADRWEQTVLLLQQRTWFVDCWRQILTSGWQYARSCRVVGSRYVCLSAPACATWTVATVGDQSASVYHTVCALLDTERLYAKEHTETFVTNLAVLESKWSLLYCHRVNRDIVVKKLMTSFSSREWYCILYAPRMVAHNRTTITTI